MRRGEQSIPYMLTTGLFIGTCAGAVYAGAPPVGLDAVVPFDLIAELQPGVRTYQASSHEPFGANRDYSRFLEVIGSEQVLLDVKGPGCIYRIWMTGIDLDAMIRIYFDDQVTPTVEMTLGEFFGGRIAPFVRPLVGDDDYSSGGFICYVPMPFARGCRITTESFGHFYNVTYQKYADATGVTTFTGAEDVTEVQAVWLAHGSDPKTDQGAMEIVRTASVSAGETLTLADIDGPGSIRQIELTLPGMQTPLVEPIWDHGRAHSGFCQFDVSIDPSNTGMVLTRRTDFGVPDQQADVLVDGVPAGTWAVAESGPGWRDVSFEIPPSLTAGKSRVTIRLESTASAVDWNEFYYWVDSVVSAPPDHEPEGQAVSPLRRTDFVDVGDPTSEEAHAYEVGGQTWEGARTLFYPADNIATDDGWATWDEVSFEVAIDPANAGVDLVRRLDYTVGNQTGRVFVDGVEAGEWSTAGMAGGFFLDHTFHIPATLTSGKSHLDVRIEFTRSDKHWTEYHYWVLSLLPDGPVRTDAIDVGDPEDEAAHHYQVQNPEAQFARTFPLYRPLNPMFVDFLKRARIVATWDGAETPQVDVPLGALFGSLEGPRRVKGLAAGMNGERMYCWFPMPFGESARLRLVNDSDERIDGLSYRLAYTPDSVAEIEGLGRFHAKHNQAVPATPGRDYVILEETGAGHLVGVVQSATGPRLGYLEGDERIYIDGSLTPALYGTGMEDFFNGGFYFNRGRFSTPTHGNPTMEGSPITTDMYRFFMGDRIVFTSSIKVGIQHGGNNETHDTIFQSVAMYYKQDEPLAVLTDELDVGNRASESAHGYAFEGLIWRGTLTDEYEGDDDDLPVTDDGRRFDTVTGGGSSFFVDIDPCNEGVLLRRRMDYSYPRQEAEVYVDGRRAGVWYDAGHNTTHQFRDSEFLVPASMTFGKNRLDVEIRKVSDTGRWTEFRYWVFSVKPLVPPTAVDGVDVGADPCREPAEAPADDVCCEDTGGQGADGNGGDDGAVDPGATPGGDENVPPVDAADNEGTSPDEVTPPTGLLCGQGVVSLLLFATFHWVTGGMKVESRKSRPGAGVLAGGTRPTGGSGTGGSARCWGVLLCVLGWICGGAGVSVCRADQRILLDGEWQYWMDAETAVPVTVPFSVEPRGTVSVYQRTFTVPPDACTHVVLLRFDGIVGLATVYLNGVELGQHGPFTPFLFDVTSVIHVGGENDIVVTIDDHQDSSTIPFDSIAWVNYSGIIRSVYVDCADDAILLSSQPQYDLAPDYSSVSGDVLVEARSSPSTDVAFYGAILDGEVGNWQVVASMDWVTATADANGLASATLLFSVDDPQLWSPESPKRYGLYVVAYVGGQLADERLVMTGFRDIRVVENDVVLNGVPILLRGVSRHDIYPDAGYVGTDAQILEDLQRIKSAGANYLRTIHYPQDPRVLDLADQLGLLVSEEVPAWANFDDPEIRQRLYVLLEEMIRRDMHHPSIFLWVTGNARTRPTLYAQEAQQVAKGLDRNRLASYVIDINEAGPDDIAADMAFFEAAQLDIFMKISWWWHYLAQLQEIWPRLPKDVPVIAVEFGQEGDDREPLVVDGENPCWWSESGQATDVAIMLEAWRPHLPQYNAEEHIAGMVYFNYQDLDWPGIVEQQPNHIPAIHTGLVYDDREPKLVLQTLGEFYTTLPTQFVGVPSTDDEIVERLFDTPTNLGPAVNGEFRDVGASLSNDGNTVYFAANGSKNNEAAQPQLYYATRSGGGWSDRGLVNMPQETDPVAFRRAPCLSYDGQTLYFTRGEVGLVCFTWPVINVYVSHSRIWKSEQSGGAWSAPEDLGASINGQDKTWSTSDPSVSPDGDTMYFQSNRPGGYGGQDLWKSMRVGGEWTEPVNLGPAVNTEADEREPSISPDGKVLYFASDRPGGLGNDDIWVTHWVGGAWTEAKNLGPEINSSGGESEPELAKNGRWLYFTGVRGGGQGFDDLWVGRSRYGAADFDHDGDADLLDFRHFQGCFSGEGAPQNQPECFNARLDDDTDVDGADFVVFSACANGPGMPAGCP